jgi:hypothetical protein
MMLEKNFTTKEIVALSGEYERACVAGRAYGLPDLDFAAYLMRQGYEQLAQRVAALDRASASQLLAWLKHVGDAYDLGVAFGMNLPSDGYDAETDPERLVPEGAGAEGPGTGDQADWREPPGVAGTVNVNITDVALLSLQQQRSGKVIVGAEERVAVPRRITVAGTVYRLDEVEVLEAKPETVWAHYSRASN